MHLSLNDFQLSTGYMLLFMDIMKVILIEFPKGSLQSLQQSIMLLNLVPGYFLDNLC